MTTTMTPDVTPEFWADLIESWDRQQRAYIAHREERFGFMIEALQMHFGERDGLTVIDLGCGPGSLTQRILEALPNATVIAVDSDPLLLGIARGWLASYGDRVKIVAADFRNRDWVAATGLGPARLADAAVSTTALHWLDPSVLSLVCTETAQVMGDRGLFLNGDHLSYDRSEPEISKLAELKKDDDLSQATASPETLLWQQWWEHLERMPELQALVDERTAWLARNDEQFGERKFGFLKSYAFYRAALLNAGFGEVNTIWRRYDDIIVAAIRDTSLDT